MASDLRLFDKQLLFTQGLAKLIQFAFEKGYQVTMGEVWRSPETAGIYARAGKGIKNSLHLIRLAADINLFRDEELLTQSEDYAPVGTFWESLSTPACQFHWGGRFGDGNHFSVGHNGVR